MGKRDVASLEIDRKFSIGMFGAVLGCAQDHLEPFSIEAIERWDNRCGNYFWVTRDGKVDHSERITQDEEIRTVFGKDALYIMQAEHFFLDFFFRCIYLWDVGSLHT